MQCSSLNIVYFVLTGMMFALMSCVKAKSPDFIKFCEDTSNDCLRESIQASLPGFIRGTPELGIERMDPFVVDNLNLTLPGGLSISFNQGLTTGFRKCVVDKARMTEDILDVQFHCNLTTKGKYSSTGRLLMFPIDGDGDSMIRSKNIRLSALMKLGSTMLNSEKHLEVKHLKVSHRFEGKVSYHMTNLFKGSPEMSKLVLEFMNRNWKLVAEEFGKPIIDFGVSSIMASVHRLFRMVPLKDIVPVPVDL